MSNNNNNQQQLALVGGGNGGGMMQLALAPVDMRQRQLDDFDVCANPELLEMFIGVACHLNTIQYCHRGKNRFQVLTTPFIRDSFQSALSCIQTVGTDVPTTANKEFNLDMWYFNMLPDEIRGRDDPTMNDIQNASSTDHDVDWFSALKNLQQRYPGVVHALYSAIQSQIKITEKSRDSFNYALNYNRSQDTAVAPRMGERILKASNAPSGGGGGHRIIGGGGGGR